LREALLSNRMNKKTTNLLLGAAVLIIWGGAGYRLISGLGDNDDLIPAIVPSVKMHVEDFAPLTDTARLKLNYRDPFGFTTLPVEKDTTHHVKASRVKIIKPAVADLSFVKYAGYISNPSSKRTLVMLLINGKAVTLNEGDSAEGIKLLKNMRDSVKVLYKNQVKYIAKAS
jgi:hypothetical protein